MSKRKEATTNGISEIVNLFKNIGINTENTNENTTGNTTNTTNTTPVKPLTFTSIDLLISKIDDIEINDTHFEHSQIIENYDALIEFRNIFHLRGTNDAVVSFMDKIDSINQYYLKNVCFDHREYNKDTVDITEYNTFDITSLQDTVRLISNCLILSLNTNDISKKLDYVITSYKNILIIVDDYNYSGNTNIKRARVSTH